MWLIWRAIGVFCKKVNRVVPLLAFLWALRACLCSNINTLGFAGGQPPASRPQDGRGLLTLFATDHPLLTHFELSG